MMRGKRGSNYRKGTALLLAAALVCSMNAGMSAEAHVSDAAAVLEESSVSAPPAVEAAAVSTLSAVAETADVPSFSKEIEGKERTGESSLPKETEGTDGLSSPKETEGADRSSPPEETESAAVSTRPAVTGTPSISTPPAVTGTPLTSTPPAVTGTPSTSAPPASVPPQIQDMTPSALSGLTLCSLGKYQVRLRWAKSEPVLFYRVYRKKAGDEKYRLLTQVKKTSYTDREVRWQQAYRYRVVPVMQADGREWTGKGASVLFQNWKAVAVDHQKYTYREMQSDIRMLEKNYSEWVDVQVIGKSEDGRNIYDVVLGNPDAPKSMIVVAAIHAREYMTSLLVMNQIEYYLQNYQKKIDGKKVKDTLDRICIHYIPMANPDGVTISQSGIRNIRSSALRKRIRKLSRGSTRYWKANARGVDLNRNFPYLFKRSGKRGSMGYTGPRGGSESETRAIVSLIRRLKNKTKLKGVVNYHAMGSIVFGDSRKGGNLRRVTDKMYRLARKTTGYRSAAGYQGSTSLGRGCLREYVMYGQKIPSITLEIGRVTCPGPIWEFPSIWRKNRKLVLYQARLLA